MDYLVDDLAALAHLRQPDVRATIRHIRLGGRLADEQIEKSLNDSYFACGCQQGSLAVIVTLVGSVALGLIFGFDGALIWWCIGLYLAGAALLGKLFGLGISRLRLHRIYRQLQSRLL
jgi:hypothetical protein